MKQKIFITAVLLFIMSMAAQATTSESMPWEDALTKIKESLAGPVTLAIGIILIIGGGIALAFTEGQAIQKVFWICIGLGIALNAARLMTIFFGNVSGFILR